MKLRKALVGLVCLTTVFTLVACKGKTTKKATTSSKTTTNIVSTTKNVTTKKQTTASTTTKSQIPSKYTVTKEVFDSYFTPASFEAAMAFNGTIDIVSTMEGVSQESKFKIEIANKYFLQTNESLQESAFKEFYMDGDKAAVDTYIRDGSSWEKSEYSPEKYTDINLFSLLNTYIPAGFDFDKFIFNYETNSYESNEEKTYTYYRGELSYTNTISNLKVKFEDNKIVSIYFKSKQCEYNSNDDPTGVYNIDVTLTYSKLGTTTVEPISAISVA